MTDDGGEKEGDGGKARQKKITEKNSLRNEADKERGVFLGKELNGKVRWVGRRTLIIDHLQFSSN